MDTLTEFSGGGLTYTFDPTKQADIRDNFRRVISKTTRLPGLDGGFDEYGMGRAPHEVGTVRTSFWLGDFATLADATAALDELGALPSWGVRRLWKQPTDTALDTRFCEARVIEIPNDVRVFDLPHKRRQIEISFEVSNPVWIGAGTEAITWGGGSLWGDGSVWGGTGTWEAVSGPETTFTVTVADGNTPTPPRINFECEAGETAENIIIERLVGGVVHDRLAFNDVLTAGDQLGFNCRALTVRLNNVNAYTSAFAFDTARWFTLEPGANNIRVRLENGGDAGRIRFSYLHLWR
jgi:hypothetical protein